MKKPMFELWKENHDIFNYLREKYSFDFMKKYSCAAIDVKIKTLQKSPVTIFFPITKSPKKISVLLPSTIDGIGFMMYSGSPECFHDGSCGRLYKYDIDDIRAVSICETAPHRKSKKVKVFIVAQDINNGG